MFVCLFVFVFFHEYIYKLLVNMDHLAASSKPLLYITSLYSSIIRLDFNFTRKMKKEEVHCSQSAECVLEHNHTPDGKVNQSLVNTSDTWKYTARLINHW